MSGSPRQALLGFTGLLTVLGALPWLTRVDDVVYRWLQFERDCEFARLGGLSGRIAAVALLAIAVLLYRRKPPLRAWLRAAGMAASGAGMVELLKIFFDRLRPNQLPAELVGNALPSGHVTSTTLIALALWTITRSARYGPLERSLLLALAVAAVLSQSLSRLVFGAHWPTDVLGSVLLAIGWIGAWEALIAAKPARPWRWVVLAVVIAAMIVTVPALRIPLSTPYEGGETAVDFDRAEDQARTRGDWRHGDREPAGTVAWLRATEGAITLPDPSSPAEGIDIALRPTARGADRLPGCVVATFTVNDWTAPPISLLTGWREIHLRPPAAAWRDRGNELRVALEIDAETRAEPSDFGWLGLLGIRYQTEG